MGWRKVKIAADTSLLLRAILEDEPDQAAEAQNLIQIFGAANPVLQGRDRCHDAKRHPSCFRCSMYCFTISSGAPPQDAAK